MRKSRFSEEQIIGMIREHEAGVKTADICRKYGISDATFCKYKAKFGGMTVSDARRLKTLEEENSRDCQRKLITDPLNYQFALTIPVGGLCGCRDGNESGQTCSEKYAGHGFSPS